MRKDESFFWSAWLTRLVLNFGIRVNHRLSHTLSRVRPSPYRASGKELPTPCPIPM